jgi:hypothetical protein
MTFTETIAVKAVPPFDFALSAQIFGSGDPQIRIFSEDMLTQVLRIDGKLMLVKLKSTGTVEAPKIRA